MKTIYQDLIETARKLELDIPPVHSQLACAFVGEWSHGKSALINSLIGIPLLPSQPIPTNKTVVRLSRSSESEPSARIQLNESEVQKYSGQAAIDALQRSNQNLAYIDYAAPNLDIPPHVLFIDTPGINDTDQAAGARVDTVSADIIAFVINADATAINQVQIDFIRQVILNKADLKDIYFVFTHGDLVQSEDDRASLQKRLGSQIVSNRVFFISNKDQSGVLPFKEAFYKYLEERQETLLEDRRQRHFRQIAEALDKKVKIERVSLQQFKSQTVEQREQLISKIQEARRKEIVRKNELRDRSRSRLNESLSELRNLIRQTDDDIEKFIEFSQISQLQQRDFIQQKIQSMIEQQIQPGVQAKLEKLLQTIQGEIQEGQLYSSQLLAEININLPAYNSPLTRITAEHVVPIAVLGSIALFGWLGIPTLLVGYVALKAKDFGLTRYGDKTGLLDIALDKIKNTAASGYKQAVKMTVSHTLNNYMDDVTDHFRNVLEKATDQAIKQIDFVEDLENTLQRLQGDGEKEIIEREISLDKAEALLAASSSQPI